MKTRLSLALVLTLALSGCNLWFTKPKPLDHGSPSAGVNAAGNTTDAAIGKVDTAKKEGDKATDQLLGKLKANVSVARIANKDNPDGQPKTKVDSELGVAESRLDKVTPDAEEMAESAKRLLLIEQGKSSEARAAYDKANAEARKQAGELSQMRAQYELSVKERDAARAAEKAALAAYERKMEENKKAMEKTIADINAKHKKQLDDAHNEMMLEQARWLNIAGFAFLAAFGLGVGFGGLAGLKTTAPLGLIALMCFGLAQVVSQPWFKWASGGAFLVGIGACLWWAYSKHKQGVLKAELEEKSTKFQSALTTIIPILDTAYDSAEDSVKQILDRTVFEPLTDKMDKADKAFIHELRANLTHTKPSSK